MIGIGIPMSHRSPPFIMIPNPLYSGSGTGRKRVRFRNAGADGKLCRSQSANGASGDKTLHGGTEPCSHRIPPVMPAVGHTLGAARPDAVHHIARARENPGIEERVAVSSKKRRVVRPERDDVGDSTGHQPRRSDAKRRRAA